MFCNVNRDSIEWKTFVARVGSVKNAEIIAEEYLGIPSEEELQGLIGDVEKEIEAKKVTAPIQRALTQVAGIKGKGESVAVALNVQDRRNEIEIDNTGEDTIIRVQEDALKHSKKMNTYGSLYLQLVGKENKNLKKALTAFKHTTTRQKILEMKPALAEDEDTLQMETLAAAIIEDTYGDLFTDPKAKQVGTLALNRLHTEIAEELHTSKEKAAQVGKEMAKADKAQNVERKEATSKAPKPVEVRGREMMEAGLDDIYNSLAIRAAKYGAHSEKMANKSDYLKNVHEIVTAKGSYKEGKAFLAMLDFMEMEYNDIKKVLESGDIPNAEFLRSSIDKLNGYEVQKNIRIPKKVEGLTDEQSKVIIALMEEVKKVAAQSQVELMPKILQATKSFFMASAVQQTTDPKMVAYLRENIPGYDTLSEEEFREVLVDEQLAERIWDEFFEQSEDANGWQRWLDYVGDSHNKIPALFLKRYSRKETKEKMLAEQKKGAFLRAYNKIDGKVDFMFQVGADGKKNGVIIPGSITVEEEVEVGGQYFVDEKIVPSNEYKALTPAQKEFFDQYAHIMEGLLEPLGGDYLNFMPAVPIDERTGAEIVKDVFRIRDVKREQEKHTDEEGRVISFIPSMFLSKLNQIRLYKIPEGASSASKETLQKRNKEISEENEKLHAEALNFNLKKTMPAFIDAMTNFNFKKEMEHEVMLTRELIARQSITENSTIHKMVDKGLKQLTGKERELTKTDNASMVRAQFEDWVQRVFYEEYNKDEGNFGKALNVLMQYTSLNTLGLNWKAGIGNKMYGEVQNLIESAAGEHFDFKDYKKHWALLNGKTLSLMWKVNYSEIGGDTDAFLIKFMDVMQDTRELITGGPVENKLSKASQMTNAAYIFNEVGEFSMQNSILFAMMDKYKLTDADGKSITMRDAWSVEDSFGELKKGIKKADGTALTMDDVADFKEDVLAVIQDLHGVYTREHSAALQKYALGRAAMQFKKWVRPAFRRRFGSRLGKSFYNERLKRVDEGAYVTTGKFAVQLMKDYRNVAESAKLHWHEMSPSQRANVKRTFAELAALLGVTLLGYGLRGILDDEEEKEWAIAFYFLERLNTELRTYTPIGGVDEYRKLRKSPMSVFSTYDKLITFGDNLVAYPFRNSEERAFQAGAYRGSSKLGISAVKLAPLANQIHSTMHLSENLNYYRLY